MSGRFGRSYADTSQHPGSGALAQRQRDRSRVVASCHPATASSRTTCGRDVGQRGRFGGVFPNTAEAGTRRAVDQFNTFMHSSEFRKGSLDVSSIGWHMCVMARDTKIFTRSTKMTSNGESGIETVLRDAFRNMNAGQAQTIREAYYKAIEGLNTLAEALGSATCR